MAARGHAPIVPVYIKKRASRWERQVVAMGEPIHVTEQYGSMPNMKEMEEICRLLEEKERKLMQLV